MSIIVRMPEIAAGAEAATIQSWLVHEGDTVEKGQALIEIETDKATIEYEAEAPGVLASILLQAGQTAEVGEPIAVLAEDGESVADAIADARVSIGADAPDTAAEESSDAEEQEETPVPVREASEPNEPQSERMFVSPIARKIAKEAGLDLSEVSGSGPERRITRRDVMNHLSQTATDTAEQSPPPAPVQQQKVETASATQAGSADSFVDVPHTGMRRAIARRLTESKTTIPHYYLTADCHVDALIQLRQQVNDHAPTKISLNDFIVKALAVALKQVPNANAVWLPEAVRVFENVDIAIAVAVPDGLLTPVVRGVEKLSVSQLSAEIRDLSERARGGRLKQTELEGGSFSVSNLGMYGTKQFNAIINPPHAGILAVGAASKRPVVSAEGDLQVANVMTVTLSMDHRVIDGALAAELLQAFQHTIENPLTILV